MIEPEGCEHRGFSGGIKELGEHGVGVVLGAEIGIGRSTLRPGVAGNFFAFEAFSNRVTIDVIDVEQGEV